MLFHNVVNTRKLILFAKNYSYFVLIVLILFIPYLILIPWNTVEFSYNKLLSTIQYSAFLSIITYFITPVYHGFSVTRYVFYKKYKTLLSFRKTLRILWRIKTDLFTRIILGFLLFIILHILINGFYIHVLSIILPNPYIFYVNLNRELYYVSPSYKQLFLKYDPTLSLLISIVFSLIIYLEVFVKKYIYKVEKLI